MGWKNSNKEGDYGCHLISPSMEPVHFSSLMFSTDTPNSPHRQKPVSHMHAPCFYKKLTGYTENSMGLSDDLSFGERKPRLGNWSPTIFLTGVMRMSSISGSRPWTCIPLLQHLEQLDYSQRYGSIYGASKHTGERCHARNHLFS